MVRPDPHDQDELGELPPLDGDARDQPESPADFADLIEESKDDATLDDATAENDPPDASEIDLDEKESGWLSDSAEANEVDLGDVAITDFGGEASLLDDSEEPGLRDEDFGFGDSPERGGLDGGEEGPTDADEELREADLPALDADEEGDADDAAVVDPGFASDEPLGLTWAPDPWSRVGAPVAFAGARAVACAARGAIVLGGLEGEGTQLVRVDLEGTCERLAADGLRVADVRAMAAEGLAVAAVVQGGRLFFSADGGEHFAPLAGPLAEGVVASEVAIGAGRLWVCTRSGGLVVEASIVTATATAAAREARRRPATPPAGGEAAEAEGWRPSMERYPVPGTAVALARDAIDAGFAAGRVGVLVIDERGRPTAIVRGTAGEPLEREVIDAPEARSPSLLAMRGPHAAYAARRGGVVRRTGSEAWRSFEWDGSVTALAFVDDAGTLVCATYSEADDTTAFVRLDGAGRTSVVARVGAASADGESDGRVAAMAYDDARGVVWVAGGFGLTTFAVR